MGQIQEIVNAIHQKGSFAPEYGIILGSGLGGLADELESPIFVNYNDLPGFPVSTAPGHMGRFVFGTLAGHRVVCMQGRLHYYEGHPMSSLALPVRVMQQLGIRALIVTNACGGVNLDFEVGDLMLIEDHINFMGTNPLIGPNADEFGPRFFDMSTVYNKTLREIARKAAASLSVPLRQGIYLGYTGPNYETPAEIRAFRTLGVDAVGMSTVPEVLAAAHCGLPVLAISLITNMAAGITEKRLDGDHVIEIANSRALVLRSLVKQIVADIPAQLI